MAKKGKGKTTNRRRPTAKEVRLALEIVTERSSRRLDKEIADRLIAEQGRKINETIERGQRVLAIAQTAISGYRQLQTYSTMEFRAAIAFGLQQQLDAALSPINGAERMSLALDRT